MAFWSHLGVLLWQSEMFLLRNTYTVVSKNIVIKLESIRVESERSDFIFLKKGKLAIYLSSLVGKKKFPFSLLKAESILLRDFFFQLSKWACVDKNAQEYRHSTYKRRLAIEQRCYSALPSPSHGSSLLSGLHLQVTNVLVVPDFLSIPTFCNLGNNLGSLFKL